MNTFMDICLMHCTLYSVKLDILHYQYKNSRIESDIMYINQSTGTIVLKYEIIKQEDLPLKYTWQKS
jgi:hypothetical protein